MLLAATKSGTRGRCALRTLSLCLVPAALLLLGLLSIPSAVAAEPEYAKAISARLNPSDKPISMSVPFNLGKQEIGTIAVRINPGDTVLVQKTVLAGMLKTVLAADAIKRLNGVGDTGGYVPLDALKAAGFNLSFDPANLALVYAPKPDDRSTGKLSLGGARSGLRGTSANAASPATIAGYVNLDGGIDHDWDSTGNDALSLDAKPVFRIGEVAVEGDWAYQSSGAEFVCPTGAICLNDHTGGLKRHFTRAIYDRPEDLLRFEFGDVEALGTDFQSPGETLGISIERSSAKLAPGSITSPTAGSAFKLDRPSDVDVIINGIAVKHLHLEAGPYDLADIPLQSGANDIILKITDDTGVTHSQSFTAFFDGALLAVGESQWAVTGGVPSFTANDERVYRSGIVTGAGHYRRGLTNTLTGEVQMQADSEGGEAGSRILTALPLGFASLGGAVSLSKSGTGFGARAAWTLANTKLLMRSSKTGRESVGLSADFRSATFREPGQYLATAGDVIYPQYDYSWRFDGTYSAPITETISANLSGHYTIANPAAVAQPYTFTGNRYGLDLTVSSPLTDTMSGSLSGGYSNDAQLSTSSDAGEWHAGFHVNMRADEHTQVAASADTRSRTADLSATTERRFGADQWSGTVDVSDNTGDDNGALAAGVGYSGNRLEARLSQRSGFNGISAGNPALARGSQRTSLHVGSAIAFADGHVAFGAPIRGNGFAIVYPHKSIAGKRITVGDPDNPRASSDAFGPALVRDLPAYSPASLAVDVADLPVGYSLGQGAFDLMPPLRAGYALEVGSSESVSAYGTLQNAAGEPIALLTGTASPEANPAKQIAIFTNGAGRFGADGLAPGRWTIQMETDPVPTKFTIVIPEGATGLFKAGTLDPVGG